MSWRCSSCSVQVSFMPGHAPAGDLPDGWARDRRGLACLTCRRLAVVAAVEKRSKGIRGRQEQRWALAEFEVRRGSAKVDGSYSIAGRTIVLSRALVAEVRRELELADQEEAA